MHAVELASYYLIVYIAQQLQLLMVQRQRGHFCVNMDDTLTPLRAITLSVFKKAENIMFGY